MPLSKHSIFIEFQFHSNAKTHSNVNTLDMFNRARYSRGHIKSSVGRAKQEPSINWPEFCLIVSTLPLCILALKENKSNLFTGLAYL